jgi:hypothetical protein
LTEKLSNFWRPNKEHQNDDTLKTVEDVKDDEEGILPVQIEHPRDRFNAPNRPHDHKQPNIEEESKEFHHQTLQSRKHSYLALLFFFDFECF